MVTVNMLSIAMDVNKHDDETSSYQLSKAILASYSAWQQKLGIHFVKSLVMDC